MMKTELLAEIEEERANQNARWGGAAHDDTHSWGEFALFIERQIRKMSKESNGSERQRFIKIAALAVAAVESMDRKAKL